MLVMIVDDDENTLELMEKAVNLLGHEAVLWPSVSDAIRNAGQKKPNLIIVDLGLLQDTSGRLFVRQFCESSSISGVPVTVVSAGWTQKDAERVKKEGSCDYLEKPINLNTLSQLINSCGN